MSTTGTNTIGRTRRAAAGAGADCDRPHAPRAEAVSIAVAGCGAVGGALIERLSRGAGDRSPVVGLERIFVREPGRPERVARRDLEFVDDIDEFLDSDAGIVVEAIGGLDPALRIAKATLERGASLVTANKALIARHGPELRALAGRNGGSILFEGAVAGGVPVLRTMLHSFSGVRIRRISGILNGTCNWVLTELEHGTPFDSAIAKAQRLGYAESDPSRDLDGRDAADKISILAWLAWGVNPASVQVRTEGFPGDPARLVNEAGAAGLRPRLVADCHDNDGTVDASVRLALVPAASPFGSTTGVDNCVRIETVGAGDYLFSGPGAGGHATASAILSDILWLMRDPV
jgi:homoserine dehydrogenase